MNRDDIHKLLGGYATGTLTEAERKTLFDAALQDQNLFNALADEEALRQLLRDPAAKAELIAALEPTKAPVVWASWLRRPMAWAAAGSLAAGLALVVLLVSRDVRQKELQLVASHREAPAPQPQPAPSKGPQQDTAAQNARAPQQSKRRSKEEQPEAPAVAAPAPVLTASRSESASELRRENIEVSVSPQAAIRVPPPDPATAISMFRQTAPPVSADAAEIRADKARPGVGVMAMRQTAAAPATTAPTGIRYEIQQRSESGMYQRVDPDLPLSSPAPLRLETETNKAGYLYAFEVGPDGKYRQLSIGPTVDAHVKHTVELGEPAADSKLLLVFSSLPNPAFTVGAATEGAARELDRLRGEDAKRISTRAKSANSVYVVGPAGGGPMLIEINVPGSQ